MKDTEVEQKELEALRDKAADEVDERYRLAYNRLRERRREGRAVVPLERGAAAGIAVTPQRQMEIRQRDRISPCEHTDRIRVHSDLNTDTVQALNAEKSMYGRQ